MSEQKKFSVGPALLAFGIGGAFAGGCMAGLAYLMARQGLSQAAAWPMASAAVCAGSLLSGWLAAFFQRSRGSGTAKPSCTVCRGRCPGTSGTGACARVLCPCGGNAPGGTDH